MGIRFRRSIKVSPGVRLNLSKSGLGVAVGRRGTRIGVGPRGPYTSFGIPGTGIYSINYLGKGGKPQRPQRTAGPAPGSSLPVPEEAPALPLPEEVATSSGLGGFLVFIGVAWFLFNQLWGGIFLLLVILIFLPHFQVARRFKKANRDWNTGRYTEAARHLEEVRRKRPGLKGLDYLLGFVWQQAGTLARPLPVMKNTCNNRRKTIGPASTWPSAMPTTTPGTPLPFCSLYHLNTSRNCRSSSLWAACSSS